MLKTRFESFANDLQWLISLSDINDGKQLKLRLKPTSAFADFISQLNVHSGTEIDELFIHLTDYNIIIRCTEVNFKKMLSHFRGREIILSSRSRKKSKSSKKIAGLANNNNTCYMNSIFQILYHMGLLNSLVTLSTTNDEFSLKCAGIMLQFEEGRTVDSSQVKLFPSYI